MPPPKVKSRAPRMPNKHMPSERMLDNSTSRPWQLQFGASVLDGGKVQFRVWAPKMTTLAVRILRDQPRTIPMTMTHPPDSESGTEFVATVPNVGEGMDYFYVLGGESDGERQRPDPVSRWQPHGVHGPSRIVDPNSFRWSDQDWAGIPLKDFIIYELHTGTFTPEGTFESVISRLPYLCDLGITAIEIMPVAEFPGNRNWGYDGAGLYPPQSSYGGPTGLKKLVDACHPRPRRCNGRGLQPSRPGRELPSRIRSMFHGYPSHPLGQGHQLRRPRERWHPPLGYRQRSLLVD